MIVYRTENKISGKFYYGVHNGKKPFYLGSGVILNKAIKKYGKENFIRRTIRRFDTIEEAYRFEEIMVDSALINDDNCYNVKTGGVGGLGGFKMVITEEAKRKLSNHFKGKPKTKEHAENIRLAKLKLRSCEGVVYSGLEAAAEGVGVSVMTIRRRMKNNDDYFFVTK